MNELRVSRSRELQVVLVVEDDRGVRDALVRALAAPGRTVESVEGISAARFRLGQSPVDCVLLDVRLRDGDGLAFLPEIRAAYPSCPVILATAYGDSSRTITAMRAGAFDYVTKPFDLNALLALVDRALRSSGPPESKVQESNEAPEDEPAASAALVGQSAAMLDVWKAIGRAAGSDAPVLITGETGVGKELVARAIHDASGRARRPFVAVNIAALPPGLVESELFGHERGAFTGATARREGRFSSADDGTLFLDEIGDLDLPLQTKLLRVLQEGTFERVGSQETLRSVARIVAATSKSVDPRLPNPALREDLYYRLGVLRIEVPPLRSRRSDIPLLVNHALQRFAQKQQRSAAPTLDGHAHVANRTRALREDAMAALQRHDWPGNVRELLHVIERACVMSASEVIDVEDLALPRSQAFLPVTPLDGSLDLKTHVRALERDLVLRALERAKGNRAEAARLLGIARPQLYVKMKDLDIAQD